MWRIKKYKKTTFFRFQIKQLIQARIINRFKPLGEGGTSVCMRPITTSQITSYVDHWSLLHTNNGATKHYVHPDKTQREAHSSLGRGRAKKVSCKSNQAFISNFHFRKKIQRIREQVNTTKQHWTNPKIETPCRTDKLASSILNWQETNVIACSELKDSYKLNSTRGSCLDPVSKKSPIKVFGA